MNNFDGSQKCYNFIVFDAFADTPNTSLTQQPISSKSLRWSQKEDNTLLDIIQNEFQQCKCIKWRVVAEQLAKRSSKPVRKPSQVSQRYRRVLLSDPISLFSEAEIKVFTLLFDTYGRQWAKISKELTAMTGEQNKHWSDEQMRQMAIRLGLQLK